MVWDVDSEFRRVFAKIDPLHQGLIPPKGVKEGKIRWADNYVDKKTIIVFKLPNFRGKSDVCFNIRFKFRIVLRGELHSSAVFGKARSGISRSDDPHDKVKIEIDIYVYKE